MAGKETTQPPPSYNQAVHGQSTSSYVPPPAPTGVQGPMVRGPDLAYLKTPGGIAKIVEAVSILWIISHLIL